MATFCTLIDNKACAKSSHHEDLTHSLLFGRNDNFGSIMSVQKWAKIYLGRIPNYFIVENLPQFSLDR